MGCATCGRLAPSVKHLSGEEISIDEVALLDELDYLYMRYRRDLQRLGVKPEHNF